MSRSATIVGEIESEVLAGKIVPGVRLPSEEQLCERFGASRTVIREAIQQLRGRGILRTTKGSGSYIADPSLNAVGSAFAAYSALAHDADFLELIDFRILIETECAWLAAERATPAIVRSLHRTLIRMEEAYGNKNVFGRLDIGFHLQVARASRSRMYSILLAALEKRCVTYAQINRGDDAWYRRVVRDHEAILRELETGNSRQAARTMRLHLVSSRKHFIDLPAWRGKSAHDSP